MAISPQNNEEHVFYTGKLYGLTGMILYLKIRSWRQSCESSVSQVHSLSKAKGKVSMMIGHGQHVESIGDRYMLLLGFTLTSGFLWSQLLCRLYKSPSEQNYKPRSPHAQANKITILVAKLKVLQSISDSEFGGLWKQQIT